MNNRKTPKESRNSKTLKYVDSTNQILKSLRRQTLTRIFFWMIPIVKRDSAYFVFLLKEKAFKLQTDVSYNENVCIACSVISKERLAFLSTEANTITT